MVDLLAENHHESSPYNYVLNNPMSYIDPLGLDTSRAGATTTIKPKDIVIGDDGQAIVSALPEVQVAAKKKDESITDGNGLIKYKGGTVENLKYTGGGAGQYAVFTDNDGAKTYFPGVQVDPALVGDGAGVTYPYGTIHLSPKDNGLEDLQHEYGHILDYNKSGPLSYIFIVMPKSFISGIKDYVTGEDNHRFTQEEVRANQLSIEYFGPKSAIANSRFYPHK